MIFAVDFISSLMLSSTFQADAVLIQTGRHKAEQRIFNKGIIGKYYKITYFGDCFCSLMQMADFDEISIANDSHRLD